MTDSRLPSLSPLEARVLGVLIEKQVTTPDYYPLTVNALVAGCNQKSNRDPVMNASEAEVEMALDALKRQTLVIDSYGASGRVMRYAHNLPKVLDIGQAATSLLAALMLRGAQTPGELRTGCERLYRFADISSVEAYLEEMSARAAGALVTKLPKQPGSREHRWAHLLSGTVPIESVTVASAEQIGSVTTGEIAALKSTVAELRDQVAELRAMVEQLSKDFGTAR
ncbi:MAG TPA: YceH family protein [Burkholderiales bacterium]|nr:YceH family protein [Burkholderiales bacterium]